MYYNLSESGKRIKDLRKKAGMTQEQLAESVGISVEMMGKLERGASGTSVDTMGQIAEALSTSMDYITYGKVLCFGMDIPEDKMELVVRVVQAMMQ